MSYFSLRANFAIKICLNKKKKNWHYCERKKKWKMTTLFEITMDASIGSSPDKTLPMVLQIKRLQTIGFAIQSTFQKIQSANV